VKQTGSEKLPDSWAIHSAAQVLTNSPDNMPPTSIPYKLTVSKRVYNMEPWKASGTQGQLLKASISQKESFLKLLTNRAYIGLELLKS